MSDRGCGHADARAEFGWLCLECFEARRRHQPPSDHGVDTEKLDTVQILLELDQRVSEIAGRPEDVRVFSELDRTIAQAAVSLGSLNRAKIAREIGVSRSTVSRHLTRILVESPYLQRFGEAALGEDAPQPVEHQLAIVMTLAVSAGIGTLKPPPTPQDLEKFLLGVGSYNQLCRLYRVGFDARSRMRHKVCRECLLSWEKGKPPPRPVSPRATTCTARCRKRLQRRLARVAAARNPRP